MCCNPTNGISCSGFIITVVSEDHYKIDDSRYPYWHETYMHAAEEPNDILKKIL